MIASNISYWFFFAFINLIKLTYEDYKYKRIVDDRSNYIMLGITLSLISHVNTSLIYKIIIMIFSGLIFLLIEKILKNKIGASDRLCMNWIILGFALLNPFYIISYVIILLLLTVIYDAFKEFLKNQRQIFLIQDRKEARSEVLPLRMQAYERLALICERIKVPNLVLRLEANAYAAKDMRMAMLITIQQEFEHNVCGVSSRSVVLNVGSMAAHQRLKQKFCGPPNTS
jgi:hypothetical protein